MGASVINNIWRWHLRDLPHRRPSWFLSSLIVPTAFWAFLVAIAPLQGWLELMLLLPLFVIAAIGVTSFFGLIAYREACRRDLRSVRRLVLVNSLYYAGAGLVSSAYLLGIAAALVARLPGLPFNLGGAFLAAYLLTGLASALFAPHTLVTTPREEVEAQEREASLLPWALGCQGFLVGMGVLLGSWFLQVNTSWEVLLGVGFSALASLVLLTLAMVGMHRFVLLLRTYPPDGETP